MPEKNVVGKPYEGKLHVRFDAAGDGKALVKATYHSLTLPTAANLDKPHTDVWSHDGATNA
jgi:hypothetical protein